MKKLLALLCWMPAMAWARYDDLMGSDEGRSSLSDVSLPIYLFASLTAWAWLVWDEGWARRWQPIALMVLCASAAFLWGYDGLGFMAIVAFFVGVRAVARR